MNAKMKTKAALHALELPDLSYVFEALNIFFTKPVEWISEACGSAALACLSAPD